MRGFAFLRPSRTLRYKVSRGPSLHTRCQSQLFIFTTLSSLLPAQARSGEAGRVRTFSTMSFSWCCCTNCWRLLMLRLRSVEGGDGGKRGSGQQRPAGYLYDAFRVRAPGQDRILESQRARPPGQRHESNPKERTALWRPRQPRVASNTWCVLLRSERPQQLFSHQSIFPQASRGHLG